jgi:hypothetical protein
MRRPLRSLLDNLPSVAAPPIRIPDPPISVGRREDQFLISPSERLIERPPFSACHFFGVEVGVILVEALQVCASIAVEASG